MILNDKIKTLPDSSGVFIADISVISETTWGVTGHSLYFAKALFRLLLAGVLKISDNPTNKPRF